jgi:carboxylate-amine ligase
MSATLAPQAKPATTVVLEDLAFQPSPAPTVGVELELQVLDRESGDLAPGSVRILQACEEERLAGTSAEMMQSMLEIKTGICGSVAEVHDSLLPVLRRVHHIARSLGYELSSGGTHPFHRGRSAALFPAERYQQLSDRLAGMAYHVTTFGLHVHVGVPDGDMAIGIINTLVQYLPHLLALSGNSPFWEGTDTGLASCRSALFQLAPHTGLPHYFANWEDFSSYCRVMYECSRIRATKDIHWDIRPRPQTGTIEFRICDMPPTLSAVLSLTALMRSLTILVQQLLEERPQQRSGDLRHYWVAIENKWLAARYGLKAQCLRSPGGKRQTLAEDIVQLLERLRPVADASGDAAFLTALPPVERLETGAERQRRIYRDSGAWAPVIDDMKQRWTEELHADKARAERRSPMEGAVPAAVRSNGDVLPPLAD